MRKVFFTLVLVVLNLCNATAQQEQYGNSRLGSPSVSSVEFFVPHWFVSAHGGASYHIGEAEFSKLISPNVQVAAGYQFSPVFGARLSVNGWEARNRYAYPVAKYSWNYVMPAAEAMLNLTNLFGGWDWERPVNAYAFAGLGVAYSFNNDDAVEADQLMRNNYNQRMSSYQPHVERQVTEFQKLWRDNRWNPVVRAGLGADVRVTDNIAIGAEVNANMLPDHWNSKKGKHDNRDWQFNALLGLKFTLGKSHGNTDPVYEAPPQPEVVDVPIDKISFNVNIYFIINQSVIRDNQIPKLTSLINYLREHPKAFVRLSGFADKETGNPTINMRLSIERAQVVSEYLKSFGISESRIRRFAKGDTVQPFEIPEDNRVCICFVYDPDNPVPQVFEY